MKHHFLLTRLAEALILMDMGCPELGSHADERSRARAARGLAAMVQSRMAGGNVAREMEWGMRPCSGD